MRVGGGMGLRLNVKTRAGAVGRVLVHVLLSACAAAACTVWCVCYKIGWKHRRSLCIQSLCVCTRVAAELRLWRETHAKTKTKTSGEWVSALEGAERGSHARLKAAQPRQRHARRGMLERVELDNNTEKGGTSGAGEGTVRCGVGAGGPRA